MSTGYETAPIAASPRRDVMSEVAAQREIAQVQAAMIMARKFPRDVRQALDRIVMACARPELAEVALYTYARGGTDITGPSIRMAEAIAQNWGNIEFGIRELEQKAGESTIEAFAIDLETNTRQVKVFQVPHVRYTKSGGRTPLEDPRDVYETAASQGARRLRACILGIIPGDVVEAAVRQVEMTLKTRQEATPERIKTMLERFAEFGVTKAQIEKRIQRSIEAITPALLVDLGKKYNSLKDGMSGVSDWFEPEDAPTNGGGAPAPATRTESVKEQLKATAPPVAESPAGNGTEAPPARSEEPTRGGTTEAAGSTVAGGQSPGGDTAASDELVFDATTAGNEELAAEIRRLADLTKMFNAEGKVEFNKRVADKWGLPVGAWQIAQLVGNGFGAKAVTYLTWLSKTER